MNFSVMKQDVHREAEFAVKEVTMLSFQGLEAGSCIAVVTANCSRVG